MIRFSTAFTLHRSDAAVVRVEPPDLVRVERPANEALTLRRADLRCSLEVPDGLRPGESFVRVVLRAGTSHVLGPFARREAADITAALSLATRDVLLATPDLSVSFSSEHSSLFIAIGSDAQGARASVEVVPTADLAEVVPHQGTWAAAPHPIDTGAVEASSSCWVELVFVHAPTRSLGPLPPEHAAVVSEAFRAWRAAHPIDLHPTVVDAAVLAADPSAWHQRRIDVTAEWQLGFEHSSFVGATLYEPPRSPFAEGLYRARVVGRWIHPSETPIEEDDFMSRPTMHAETIEILDTLSQPESAPAQASRDADRRMTSEELREQLHALEAAREHATARGPRVVGAVYSDSDRSRPSAAGWWQCARGDVAAVFSGTGGQSAGDAFVRMLRAAMTPPTADALVDRARWPIERAQAAALAALGPAFVAFGTMATVAVDGERAAIAHVGDARVVRIRAGRCERLTVDHRAEWRPNERMLTCGIGMREGFAIEASELTWAESDVLLLCTHAIWEMLDDALLSTVVDAQGLLAPEDMVSRLVAHDPAQSGAVVMLVRERRGA